MLLQDKEGDDEEEEKGNDILVNCQQIQHMTIIIISGAIILTGDVIKVSLHTDWSGHPHVPWPTNHNYLAPLEMQ